ncbi:MAG TPA: AMP-binding protein, partial [Spirochaetia bacterium]|nr:AMP-binding protein [Spirochaetia bacterium]
NRVVPSRNLHSVREMVEGFHPDRLTEPALTMKRPDGYWTLSYGELREHVRALGTALLSIGVRPGDRVGLISENRSEWVITYLAVTCIGAVIVPYDILLKVEELSNTLRASGARLVFTSAEYLEKVTRAVAGAGEGRLMLFDAEAIRTAESSPGSRWSASTFTSLVQMGTTLRAGGDGGYAKASVSPDDLAALIFTSGTTGTPKGVMLSHRNLVENGDGVQMTTPLGPGDNWIIVLPFHHTYPTSMGVFTPLLTYGRITSVPSLKTHVLVGIMKDTGATCVPAMPLLIERLYKGILSTVKERPPIVRVMFRALFAVSRFLFRALGLRVGKLLFRSVARELGVEKLRFFVSGGGPIAREIIDGMEALGLVTYQGYGLTEASPVVSSCCPAHNRPGSVGLPLANVEVRIDAPDANGNGEILARGPNIMMGYLDMPDKTREVLDEDGWLHTGDIGAQDRDGYLYITGRLKNIIVTKGGKNIYPEEIENLLMASPLLSDVLVIGKLDEEGGEYPHAIVYPDPEALKAAASQKGRALTAEEIRALVGAEIRRCTANAAAYKVPHGFEVSEEELPKTSTRKVKRYLFAGSHGAPR